MLSTISGIPASCAMSAILAISTTSEFGFPSVSIVIAFVFGWIAALIPS